MMAYFPALVQSITSSSLMMAYFPGLVQSITSSRVKLVLIDQASCLSQIYINKHLIILLHCHSDTVA
jgi:hypothetical protein